jgi:hypothetical protein
VNGRRVSPGDVIFYVIIVAIVFSLVRPGSKAGAALVAVTDAAADVIGWATGYAQRG